VNNRRPITRGADAVAAVGFASGERVWLNVRGRHAPAVIVDMRGRHVLLRVQRVDRWDAVRIVRGRARPSSLTRRESAQLVDQEVQS